MKYLICVNKSSDGPSIYIRIWSYGVGLAQNDISYVASLDTATQFSSMEAAEKIVKSLMIPCWIISENEVTIMDIIDS